MAERSQIVSVRIDLDRICRNVEEIATKVQVPILAVVKADAYGLGAQRVASAIAPLVGGFCTFSLEEVIAALLRETGRTTLVLGPTPAEIGPEQFTELNARPAVWTVDEAARLRHARPVLAVDTGMQRFACPAKDVARVLDAGGCDEAFTHATKIDHVRMLREIISSPKLRLHAAASALLDEQIAWLDAVRPGLAMYRGAARVSTRLAVARDTSGPAGYHGFTTQTGRHGVIITGYSNCLRPGPCAINGEPRRVIEVGMQSAFVEIGPKDRVGDEVTLLGDSITEDALAAAWATSAQEVLVRLTGAGQREYSR